MKAIDAETTSDAPPSPTDVDAGRAPVTVGGASGSCVACAALLEPDQRYCVECGQPRVPARLPYPEPAAPPPAETPVVGAPPVAVGPAIAPAAPSRAPRLPNATVFAVVGALLLAAGIGVLIGRSERSTVSSTGPGTVTVVLSGSGAALAGAAPAVAASASTTGTTGPAGTAAKTAAKTTKTAAAAAAAKPPPKAVKLGSSGSGPGYQKGKFTGNFFGGGG